MASKALEVRILFPPISLAIASSNRELEVDKDSSGLFKISSSIVSLLPNIESYVVEESYILIRSLNNLGFFNFNLFKLSSNDPFIIENVNRLIKLNNFNSPSNSLKVLILVIRINNRYFKTNYANLVKPL